MANTFREKELKTTYPFTDGIIAGTTTQEGHVEQLEAKGINGIKSNVREIDRIN